MFTNFYLFIKSFFQKIGKDRIYNYSASSVFFIILSIFPFLILIVTIIQYTPLTEEFVLARFQFLLPDPIFPLFKQILEEIYSNTGGATLIFVSAVGGLWSASKGIYAMIRGINTCFNINDKRSWLRIRLLSCLYTLITLIAFILSLFLLVFGSTIYNTILSTSVEFGSFLGIILFILRRRVIIALIILTLVLVAVYCLFPAKKKRFLIMLPGALLAAGAWVGLSELLSLYLKAFPNFSYTYGSLTTFILLMLYLYFGMYIIFVCAEINFFFESWLESIAASRKRKKAIKYEAHIERKQEKYETKKLKSEEKEELKRLIDQKKHTKRNFTIKRKSQ